MQDASFKKRAQALKQKRVLIIDDDKSFIAIYSDILIRRGFNVVTTISAKEGLGILQNIKIDLVLLDINMPEMDGTTFLRILRKAESIKETKVVVKSAYIHDTEYIITKKTIPAADIRQERQVIYISRESKWYKDAVKYGYAEGKFEIQDKEERSLAPKKSENVELTNINGMNIEKTKDGVIIETDSMYIQRVEENLLDAIERLLGPEKEK